MGSEWSNGRPAKLEEGRGKLIQRAGESGARLLLSFALLDAPDAAPQFRLPDATGSGMRGG